MKIRSILSICAVFALQACALAPGMKVSLGDHPVKHYEGDDVRPVVPVVEISPRLLLDQAKQKVPEPKVPEQKQPPRVQSQLNHYEYHISPFDVLGITVWDHPELMNPSGGQAADVASGNTVRSDGTIFFPYAGILHVAGKTVEEVRAELTKALHGYIENPQLDVRILSFRGQRIYVTGEVAHPAVIPVKDVPLTVVDAIEMAGGAKTETSDLQHVRLVDASGKVSIINVLALTQDGDISQNRVLRNGDTVNVPNNYYSKVFVTGEVNEQKAIPLVDGALTLAEALSEVGGVSMKSANPEKIYVIRANDPATEKGDAGVIYHLDASSPDAYLLADQFQLKARDVVFVSTAEVVRWGRVMDNLAVTVQALALTRLFSTKNTKF